MLDDELARQQKDLNPSQLSTLWCGCLLSLYFSCFSSQVQSSALLAFSVAFLFTLTLLGIVRSLSALSLSLPSFFDLQLLIQTLAF